MDHPRALDAQEAHGGDTSGRDGTDTRGISAAAWRDRKPEEAPAHRGELRIEM